MHYVICIYASYLVIRPTNHMLELSTMFLKSVTNNIVLIAICRSIWDSICAREILSTSLWKHDQFPECHVGNVGSINCQHDAMLDPWKRLPSNCHLLLNRGFNLCQENTFHVIVEARPVSRMSCWQCWIHNLAVLGHIRSQLSSRGNLNRDYKENSNLLITSHNRRPVVSFQT